MKPAQDKLLDLAADLDIEAKPASGVLCLARAVLWEAGRYVSGDGNGEGGMGGDGDGTKMEKGEGGGKGKKTRRTRAVRAFFSARPAAFRTNTALDSLASSDASVCMYPGCVCKHKESMKRSTKKKRQRGRAEDGECGWVMKGDVHSSPGMPALVFAWHFHA